ncbi:glycosyltransferase [Zobellella maritima]|uniref:glycosyltransferase n=1 Tax=Zobellella maritima TaxID=2059725 RepID=UPI0018E514BE|nr:glycosyltransferase [Zobellella maritima]
MNGSTLVQNARAHYNTGQFKLALELYLRASEIYGRKIFTANINLCKKKLTTSTQSHNPKKSFINSYFDHVYLVNLEHDKTKKLKSSRQLKDLNIDFELFKATDGYIGKPKEMFDEYFSKPLGCLKRYSDFNETEINRASHFIDSPGAMGYIHTYLEIINDAKKNNYKRFLILEDDVILCHHFENKAKAFLSKISNNWKVIQLGASQYNWNSVNEPKAKANGFYYPRQLDTCGSFAIAFDHSIIDELSMVQSTFEAPFDHLPLGEIYEKYLGECFVAYPNIAMPDVSNSSIRSGRCQYTHGKRMKWKIENFHYPYPKPSIAVILSHPRNLKYFNCFSHEGELPFNLRLYYDSEDGLRPLHNADTFIYSASDIKKTKHPFQLPTVDFCTTLSKDDILTEGDILNYIEFELGLSDANNTPLVKVNPIFTECVKGRVSVIIPTYKRPENLANALESVLSQDYEDVEVLVVNDNGENSPHNKETRSIITQKASLHPNKSLKLIEHSVNRNGSAARNTAIMISTGEYICFLDDDDIYLPGRITKSVETLSQSNGLFGATYCGFLGWNSPKNDLNRYTEGDLSLEILMLNYKKHYLCTNTATYKREAVLAINGFDESYCRHQDLEFNLRFFELYKIKSIKECLVRLSPEPSIINNKLHNKNILNLKLKFLEEFDSKIMSFGEVATKEIYEKHWLEVIKYVTNKDLFISELSQDYKDVTLQVIQKLTTSDK